LTVEKGALTGVTAPDEPAATAAAEAGETACATGFDPDSCAAGTDPEFRRDRASGIGITLRRCKSVRMSAACW
jgi:hypothetical protein